jgi:hypothetical protein
MFKIRGKDKASKPAKKTKNPSLKKKAVPRAAKKRTSRSKSPSLKGAPKKKSHAQAKAGSKTKTSATGKTPRAVKKTAPAGKKGAVSKLKTSSKPKASASSKKSPGVKKATAPRKKSPAIKKSASKKPASLKSAAKKSTKASTPATKTAKPKKSPSAKKKVPVRPPFTAYKGIRPFLFTSYAHKNMKEVFRIIKKLNSSRFRIWYDEGIEPGNEWPEVVGSAIVNCTQFLVFMSPHAADSRNVRNEINLAFSENKDIIVIFLQRTNLSEGMKLQIGTVQFINRFELTDREFSDKLTKVLSNALRN